VHCRRNGGRRDGGKVTTGGGDAGAYEVFTYVPGAGFVDACVTVLTF
jgi:hypothetical protein